MTAAGVKSPLPRETSPVTTGSKASVLVAGWRARWTNGEDETHRGKSRRPPRRCGLVCHRVPIGAPCEDHVRHRLSRRGPEDQPGLQYIEDLAALGRAFPDYRWELRRVIVDGEWLAVHLHDAGTRAGLFLGAAGNDTLVQTH